MGYDISTMVGLTMAKVFYTDAKDELIFLATNGWRFRFYHSQDCCEHVRIEDICGDLQDLVGTPIMQAEEVSSEGWPPPEYHDSYTWTFYRFATAKGFVTLRWLGESNGYYGENVDLEVTAGARP